MKSLKWIVFIFLVACCSPNPVTQGDGDNQNGDSDKAPDCSFFAGFMAHADVFNGEAVTLTVSGMTGNEARYNGHSVSAAEGTWDIPVCLTISPAIGVIDDPAGGRLVRDSANQAHGLDISAWDARDNTREVMPLKTVEILFPNHRGKVLYLVPETASTFGSVDFSITPLGSLGRTPHLSLFLLEDTPPEANASATATPGSRKVPLSFAGTVDEGSTDVYFLTFSAVIDGSTLGFGSNPHPTLDLDGGSHTIIARVIDPYGNISGKTLDVMVDLCSVKNCAPQECQPSTGACVDGPCHPNTCAHLEVCTVTGPDLDDYTCACQTNWSGQDCNACSAGNYVSGEQCLTDGCYNVTCSGHGNCLNHDGVCSCNAGWATSANCAACLDGYTDAHNGTCKFDPCHNVNCGSHGSCNAGVCDCTDGYSDSTCSTPPHVTVSNTLVDCSSTGVCASDWPTPYPLTFNYTYAVSCTATSATISGVGTSGVCSSVSLSTGTGTGTYTADSGTQSTDIIRVTTVCLGNYGDSATDYTEFMLN